MYLLITTANKRTLEFISPPLVYLSKTNTTLVKLVTLYWNHINSLKHEERDSRICLQTGCDCGYNCPEVSVLGTTVPLVCCPSEYANKYISLCVSWWYLLSSQHTTYVNMPKCTNSVFFQFGLFICLLIYFISRVPLFMSVWSFVSSSIPYLISFPLFLLNVNRVFDQDVS
jgi:hypothetical protein